MILFMMFFKLLLETGEDTEDVLRDLHKSFAALTQEEQKFANIFLHDVQRGDVTVEDGKTLRDYITEYQARAKNDQIHRFAEAIGVNEAALREFMKLHVTEADINAYGRFDRLKETVNTATAKAYFDSKEATPVPPHKVRMKIDQILRQFVLKGGIDV